MTPPAAASPAVFVDLHVHSTASDGALAPEAVVAAARAAGLAAIALTDHDTCGGVEAARLAGEREGVEVIAGVELSAMRDGKEIHLLGLHLHRVDAIEGALVRFRDDRVARAEEIVRALNAKGVPVTMDAVRLEAGEGAFGRPHVARALVAGGWVSDLREAFDRWLAFGRPAYVAKPQLDAADAIRLVHDAGGVAVWAHPGGEGRRDAVEKLAAAELDGVETLHPSHTQDDRQRLGALADHYGLVTSGGSDWHGHGEGPRALGGMRIPLEVVTRQRERAERWRNGA